MWALDMAGVEVYFLFPMISLQSLVQPIETSIETEMWFNIGRSTWGEREYKVLIGTPIIKMQMGSVTRYHCDKCGMEFDSLAELNNHQITKHTTD